MVDYTAPNGRGQVLDAKEKKDSGIKLQEY